MAIDILKLERPPTHPGEMLLEEFLKPRGISQSDFARRLDVSFPRLNDIIHGRRGVSTDTALRLARVLGTRLDRFVRDDTRLEGNYEFNITFTPDEVLDLVASRPATQVPTAIGSDGIPIDPNGPSLMTALREQLGLRLDSRRGPVEVLVIDHVERPTSD